MFNCVLIYIYIYVCMFVYDVLYLLCFNSINYDLLCRGPGAPHLLGRLDGGIAGLVAQQGVLSEVVAYFEAGYLRPLRLSASLFEAGFLRKSYGKIWQDSARFSFK